MSPEESDALFKELFAPVQEDERYLDLHKHLEAPTKADLLMLELTEEMFYNSEGVDGEPLGIMLLLDTFDNGRTFWAWSCKEQKPVVILIHPDCEITDLPAIQG